MITFQPDMRPLLNPAVMVASLRGRILARQALKDQERRGSAEELQHEQAIAAYEQQIEQLQSFATRPAGAPQDEGWR